VSDATVTLGRVRAFSYLESAESNATVSPALAWAEGVTLVADGHAPDEVFEEARRHFNDEELTNLTLGVVAINGWNRLSIALFRPR